jgi:ParB-like chromosome segregation protein Spo0J
MKLINVPIEELVVAPELSRSGSAKSFEERLQSSIDEIGVAEPLKVAPRPDGRYVVIDGVMRVRAIRRIRQKKPDRFPTVAAYVFDYEVRYELRYQSDIYQDLLPSQLATLVEHLHQTSHVRKLDIARYIGVSPTTIRNYTGLWRLLERGGLFAKIVELMDVAVLPSSNPYAWLRLTDAGLQRVLTEQFSNGQDIGEWITDTTAAARLGTVQRYPAEFVESVTSALPATYFRVGAAERRLKRDLGLRRRPPPQTQEFADPDLKKVRRHLTNVSRHSPDVVLRSSAHSLLEYLR